MPTAPAILPTAISLARATRAPPARVRARRTSRANTSPAVIGSAWMPCERPIIGVRAVLVGARGGRRRAAGRCRPGSRRRASTSVDRERRVEHVRRRHPEVQPARRLARQLLDVGQERDHVVARALLVLEDARRDPACRPPWRAPRRSSRPAPSPPSPSRRRPPARRAARSRSGGCRTRGRPAPGACIGESWSAFVLTKTRRWFKDRAQGMSSVDPVVLRASRSRWAAAASRSA